MLPMFKHTLNKLIPFVVRPELVEGLIQRILNILVFWSRIMIERYRFGYVLADSTVAGKTAG